MTVNQLPTIPMFRDCNHFEDKAGIQNIFPRARHQEVLQNNYFADNTKQDKTDKDRKVRIIDSLNELIQAVYSKEPELCIN